MGDGGCPRFEEAISARLDGEDPGVGEEVLDAHLARCPSCQAFAAGAERLHRRMRVRFAEAVPDDTDRIIAAIRAEWPLGVRRPRRSRRWAVAAVTAATAAATAGATLAIHSQQAGPVAVIHQVGGPSLTNPDYPGATVLPNPVPKPQVMMTDTAGDSFDIPARTVGTVTVMYFGYTHCPDVCPINMALTARAIQDIPASMRSKVTVVFVTTDPGRDTGAVIRAWLDKFDPAFIGLRTNPDGLHQAEQQVGMPLSYAETAADPSGGSYTVVHAGYLLVYSQDGLAHLQVDVSEPATQLATVLEHLVSRGYRPN